MAASCCALCVAPSPVQGASAPSAHTYRAARYVVRWSAGGLDVRTLAGRLLTRWPVGASCVPADPTVPVAPSALEVGAEPTLTRDRGCLALVWRWRFTGPQPFAEQRETYRLLADRIECQVALRWRSRPTRLVRMVYGGRLAAGCCDLEGLWETQEAGTWRWAPVPGVTARTGDIPCRRRVLWRDARPARLVLGGVDDGDVAAWDGVEIGRTPSDTAARSWTVVRRYGFAQPAGSPGLPHDLTVTVTNAAGQGGIWRGPCVVGPASVLGRAPGGDGWTRAQCTGRALHHWCPDTYSQPLTRRFTVSLTSQDRTRETVPENVTTGGRFLLPPYVAAIDGTNGWWGLGTLDLPRAEDGLRVEWRDGALTCPFLLATEAGASVGGWSAGPRLAILVGGSQADILRRYLAALPRRSERARRDWWSGPEYCTWGDQVYAGKLRQGPDVGSLSEARLEGWLRAVAEARIEAPLVVLDAGWWQLPQSVVARLHAQGRHVTVWTQPHWGPDTTRHAEWAMRDPDGQPLTYDPGNWILDYTVPEVRRHMAGSLRSYLSASGWNADGIKLDFPYTAAPVWAVHADPGWGAGEAYRARVLRFIYQAVKAVKADALVTCVCANPLFGPVQDVCRLNDDWTGDPQTYRRRAAVALATGEWANCDDWHAYESYLARQAAERPVWGTLTLMSALYRGDRQNAPMPLSPAWRARLSAITHLARLAPVRAGQRCVYDPARGIARRVGPDGELVAAALPLRRHPGRLCVLVVRDGARLLVTSTCAGTVRLPVGGPGIRVVEIGHDGSRRPAHEAVAGGIYLHVEDAAGPVSHYEVLPSARRLRR